MRGIPPGEIGVFGSLYKSLPLAPTTTLLMMGRAGEVTPHEPVAWTNSRPNGGKVFYTSLGHPDDFDLPAFQTLLRNAVYWAADVPLDSGQDTVTDDPC